MQVTTAVFPQRDLPPLSSLSVNSGDGTTVQGTVQLQSETLVL